MYRIGATIVYATHIFDGLDDWPTHVHYLNDKGYTGWQGRLEELDMVREMRQRGETSPLLRVADVLALRGDVHCARAPVAVPLQQHALGAVEGLVRPVAPPANDAAAAAKLGVVRLPEGAFVADEHGLSLVGVGIADDTPPVAVVAQAADGGTGDVPAQVDVLSVARHCLSRALRWTHGLIQLLKSKQGW